MKNRPSDSQKRLDDILNSIHRIENYTELETGESFMENQIANEAVLYNFSIIGEAIIYIEKDILDKYDYPWYKARSFRNLIVYEYFNIKLEAVWDIIKKDLPELKAVIKTILENEFQFLILCLLTHMLIYISKNITKTGKRLCTALWMQE